MNRLPPHIATRIYDILVAEAGASDSESTRHSFMYTFCRDEQPGRNYEFRFGGKFGFAGKFWWNNERFYVSGHSRGDVSMGGCDSATLEQEYPEIDRINALLAPLYYEFEQYRIQRGMLDAIPAFQQHQGSTTDQLRLLIAVANKLGLQDAADFIQNNMRDR